MEVKFLYILLFKKKIKQKKLNYLSAYFPDSLSIYWHFNQDFWSLYGLFEIVIIVTL